MGSASELEYHLLLAHDLGFLDEHLHHEIDQDLASVKRMLNSFIQKLKANS
jgi:four helix bundle protein